MGMNCQPRTNKDLEWLPLAMSMLMPLLKLSITLCYKHSDWSGHLSTFKYSVMESGLIELFKGGCFIQSKKETLINVYVYRLVTKHCDCRSKII